MQITSTVNTTSNQTAGAEATASQQTVDYNSFLQLLVAQLKNQDPLNPQDPSQFVSQLSQLSGLEQAIKQNDKLDQLLSAVGLGQASGLLGRTVTSADGQTSGVVVAAKSTVQGVVATLDSGKNITIGPGVVVAA